ncbi:MAG: hypothetical protein ABR569_14760 [Gaiellaceae bacterium]
MTNRGLRLEECAVGDVYPSRFGRTSSQTDNTWFTALTMNVNQIHLNAPRRPDRVRHPPTDAV